MKSSFLLVAALMVVHVYNSKAQTDPLYAQYLNNPLLINPAYSGFNNQFNASTSYRKQWAGFDGNPETINANAHTSLNNNKMGVGLIVLQDKIGSSKNSEIHATYAYKLDLQNKYFSFGLQAGVVNFRNDNSNLNIYDPTDPAFLNAVNTTKPSFGAGAILHNDRYFIGVSVPRLLKAQTNYNSVDGQLYSQHFYAMGSYNFFINEHVRVKPSVLLRGVRGASLSTDFNIAFNLNEKYTVGAFSRNFNTYGLLAQFKIGEKYRFGYVFEVPTNSSVGARFTSHELTFGINMGVFQFQDQLSVSTF